MELQAKDDKLDKIFQMQEKLIDLIIRKDKNFEGKEQNSIMQIIAAMHNELEELRNWFPWKPWKTYPKDFTVNMKEVKLEVIDLLHFLIEFAITVCEMDSDELFSVFKNKHETNIKRHEGDY